MPEVDRSTNAVAVGTGPVTRICRIRDHRTDSQADDASHERRAQLIVVVVPITSGVPATSHGGKPD
jgi:hypothetical protein